MQPSENEALFKAQDVRLLREFAAYVANKGTNTMRARAMDVLKRFAMAVHTYCEHPDKARDIRDQITCLSCGKRFEDAR